MENKIVVGEGGTKLAHHEVGNTPPHVHICLYLTEFVAFQAVGLEPVAVTLTGKSLK